jgi:hypothetical protein
MIPDGLLMKMGGLEKNDCADSLQHPRPLLHLLAGTRLSDLVRILSRYGRISPRGYLQISIMLASAFLRAPSCIAEARRVADRLRTASFDPPPVFIVGHWRSGTTFLHNLISRDARFCFPTIMDTLRPYDFYPNPLEFISRRVLLRFLPSIRPMDDVRLDPHLPQEEEFALATMAAASFLNCLYFPERMTRIFAEEVLFAGISDETLRFWRQALTYYLAKLAALHPGRRLLLKNPAHSARIPHLRSIFAGAKFIHIHRHPRDVFHSTVKFYRSMLPLFALQRYDPAAVNDHVLWAYPQLMNRLLDALAGLPSGQKTVVRYDDLAADPMTTVERIYRDLDLGEFGRVKSSIAAYAAIQRRDMPQVSSWRAHAAPPLTADWQAIGARLGYSLC